MQRLEGKVALVTGAARGIGAETARQMAKAGAKVVLSDVLADRAKETAAAISAEGGEAIAVHHDVADEASWHGALALAKKRFGGLDILVNNAGIYIGRDIFEVTMEDWSRLVAINMTGVYLGTKLCAEELAERGKASRQGSSIINLSSVAGLVGAATDPLYAMTKGGVLLFTKSMALVFGRWGWRIRVNAIHPGVIGTDMGDQVFVARAAHLGGNDVDAARAYMEKQHPIGRIGTAEDVAMGAVFLASDESGFMTGSSLVVDGGLTAQ